MKNVVAVLMIVLLSACTYTRHTVFPAFGYDFQPGEKMIVAKFQRSRHDGFSEKATRDMIRAFSDCGGLQVMNYDSVQNILYSDLAYTSPIWKIDTRFMVRLYAKTEVRYLLLGKIEERADQQPVVSTALSYPNGTSDEISENRVTFAFEIYDLATARKVLSTQTKVTAGQLNHGGDEGDTHSFRNPVNLPRKALQRGIRKLREVCRCDEGMPRERGSQ
jgi:hypothetical protein